MFFGADYYPEHWPVDFWKEHARLMREAHINVVRIGEFAWSKIEPKEGVFDFSWLDSAIDVLAGEGIKVVLGTPTATPPKWLMDSHPDIYMRDGFGQIRGFGSRRHYCYNNPAYRKHTVRIVSAMAEHYKACPHVVMWQIDNEFGCHDTVRCYCENCRREFIGWLQRKYKTLKNLNNEWGTVFWSQIYTDWDEIILPMYTVCDCNPSASGDKARYTPTHNPGLLLDFYRFSSDSLVAYQSFQIETLRSSGCTQPITHNMMGHFDQVDYFDLGKALDIVVWDNYINTQWGKSDYRSISMAHDLMRGIKEKNFWVMEQQSGPCGWNYPGDTPKPGQLRLWTYQAVAHGADGVVYFRWRACPFGIEQYWYGILDHDGVPRRRYREIQQTGKELSRLSDMLEGAETAAEAAIVKSFDNLWSHGFQPHNKDFDYNSLLSDYYYALSSNHIICDMISAQSDFSKYKLLFMPAFNLMTDELAEKVKAYVEVGGSLVITFRSGTKTWNNAMTLETLPGYFRAISGVTVEEFDSLSHGRTVRVEGVMGEGTARIWCDVLKSDVAEVLARYAEDYYAGAPAVTVNSYGRGKVFYVGCALDAATMKTLMKHIASESRIQPLLTKVYDGIEVVKRLIDGKAYLILLNHGEKAQRVEVDGIFTECLSGKEIHHVIELDGYGVAILLQSNK